MRGLALLLSTAGCLAAQTARAAFEVVSVKPSPPLDSRGYTRGCKGGPGTGDPGRWTCTNATISMLLIQGYNLKRYQLTVPDWTSAANYEIAAKLPPDTSREQFREMVRNLLSERFKLEFHWGKKDLDGYELVVGKGGSKLVESAAKPPGDPKNDAPGWGTGGKGPAEDDDGYPNIPASCRGCMAINGAGKARYRSSEESVANLAEMIGNQLGMPVADKTGLTGKYDITLSWNSGGGISRRAEKADVEADLGMTIEAAVFQQLGLKLESRKVTVDTITVDKAERNPPEN